MSLTYIKNEQGLFVCPNCNIVEKHQSTMHYHMKTHEGKLPYECDICKKDFMQKRSLELHKLRHSDSKKVKDFKCPFDGCKFEANTKANRRIHCMRKHFKNETDIILGEDNSCESCKSKFSSTTAFYYHAINCVRVNSAEKQKILESII